LDNIYGNLIKKAKYLGFLNIILFIIFNLGFLEFYFVMENKELKDKQAQSAKRLRQLLSQKQKNDIKMAFDYFDQGGAGKIKKKELK